MGGVPFTFSYLGYTGQTYLTLCQKLIRECGISGSIGSTIGATGEMARVTGWIADSWLEIQTQHDDWNFMKYSYLNQNAGTSFTTTSGLAVYPLGSVAGTTCMVPPINFGKWDPWSFRNFTTTNTQRSDEIFLDPITYDEWRDAYMYGSLRQVRTRPVAVAIAPDMSVCLGPPSNGMYTVEADYWLAPQMFVNDVDVPVGLQPQYHMLIVYRAMKKYAGYESAPEVYQRADQEYNTLYRGLEAKFGPQMLEGAALT